jgi:decaprenylphospho-beta-D-erythro-pentofuranosid-2-ulose 2-reductase
MKVVFLGATKGMGRALARRMAERGDRLHLLGRDLEDLARSARDLELRGPAGTTVTYSSCDLAEPDGFDAAIRDADAQLGEFDVAVVTAGLFGTQEALETDRALTGRVLTADFTNTVLFCEAVRTVLLARGGGTLCVFSSIAGERGRKKIVIYGAAKAGLSAYLEGLDHRFRSKGLRTVCVKPGFVTTSMTEGLPVPPFACDAEAVAGPVLKAIDRGTPVVYVPTVWALVMLVIRQLPRFVMRRVDF